MKVKQFKLIVFATVLLTSINTFANPPIHTWHNVTSLNGTWHARLQGINEQAYFYNADGTPRSEFTVNQTTPERYGFGFPEGTDFNIAYTLTLTQEDSNNVSRFSSKACVYVVTASGPGQPDIRASSFNGAKCELNVVPGATRSFTVS